MKKILLGLLLVVLILIALMFYQRQKVARSLADLLKGDTYGSYGIKIQIPPSSGSVKGFFKPYVNLPRVILDLSAWGIKVPFNMDNAVAFQDLWGNGSLILEVPRKITPVPGWALDYPTMELGSDQKVRLFGAKSFSIQTETGEEKDSEKITFFNPKLQIGSSSGVIPSLLILSVDGLENDPKGQPTKIKAELGPMNLGIQSKTMGESREWEIFSLGEGGVLQMTQGEAEFGGWKFALKGTSKELLWEAFSELDPKKSLYEKALQFFEQSQVMVHSKDLSWEGLKIVDGDGGEDLLVSPLKVKAEFKEENGDLKFEAQGQVSRIHMSMEEGTPLDLKGLEMNYSGKYSQTSFPKLMAYLLRNYGDIFTMAKKEDPQEAIKNIFFSSIAQYPDYGQFEFTIEKVQYETKSMKARHRNLALISSVKPSEVSYTLRDEFDLNFEEDSKKDIESGKAELTLTFKFPWQGLLELSRKYLETPLTETSIAQLFQDQTIGFDLILLVDLGANYFGLDLDSKIALPLNSEFVDLKLPSQWTEWKNIEKWWGKFSQGVVRQFVQKGLFLFDLKVERLGKLQATLEEVKSGASLGLLLLAPYTVVDAKEDTMKMKLELKEGKVLVNEKQNEALQKLILPFFQKMQTPLVPVSP